jgi:hypothetical protein
MDLMAISKAVGAFTVRLAIEELWESQYADVTRLYVD